MLPSEYCLLRGVHRGITHIPQSPGSESDCLEVGIKNSRYSIQKQRSHFDLHHQHSSYVAAYNNRIQSRHIDRNGRIKALGNFAPRPFFQFLKSVIETLDVFFILPRLSERKI
jgi:hypothetical protein